MVIVYSSDENYVQHMAVSMVSLFRSNEDVEEINVFIIANQISDDSKSKLVTLANSFGRSIYWIDFVPFGERLALDMEWPISVSSYARLFLAEMLPEWCSRAIYLDCDTIVCDNLSHLCNLDMKGYLVAGVKDLIRDDFKHRIGLASLDIYINAGVMLIDLSSWRKKSIQKDFLLFISERMGRVTHHDQGVINGVLKGQMLVLPPRYNSLTPFFTYKYVNLLEFYNAKPYYSEDEIIEAVNHPAIIHFTPEFVGRVWEEKCKHPKASLYKEYLDETCWKGNIRKAEPLPLKLRLLYWMYRNLPAPLMQFIINLRKK